MAHQSKTLKSRSWQELYRAYRVIGEDLKAYERVNLPETIDIYFPDEANVFILNCHQHIDRLDAQLSALDEEIARRNKLVCVV